jgi:putative intracellular protease/amidase
MDTIQQVIIFPEAWTYIVLLGMCLQPEETAVPYMAFKKAGFEIQFATENGKIPECDEKMLRGITQKLLVNGIYRHPFSSAFANLLSLLGCK